ncbi:MAG: DUF1772 domain-containing protein [Candidatus Omnitrophica bacterium]|nr:DUF1772 domain-containing protein [Candidatus Omnitrophota bacterium]
MLDQSLFLLTLISIIGSGLMAGLYFIFSNTIMRALQERPPAEGMAVMQAINRVILNPLFFLVFFGTAVTSLLIVILVISGKVLTGRPYLIAGSLLYLIGNIFITITRNVPLNNALDRADATNKDGREVWADYLKRWTTWNHVRTVACVGAMAGFALGL